MDRTEPDPASEPLVRAAGGVVWRPSPEGPEVALVHRPAYDDWSFPKGKLQKDEDELAGALREVLEETGVMAEPVEFVGRERYRDRKDRLKEVAYWSMRAGPGRFAPTEEIDEVRWLRVGEADRLLSYPRDAELLRRVSGRVRRPGGYAKQALTYDRTRGASPSVLRGLAGYTGAGEGRRLLDVASGTGNYAQALQSRGFDVVASDVEPAMLLRSVAKIGSGRQVVADAARLPFADASFDVATMVFALHLMRPPEPPLLEIRRVLRAGPLVIAGVSAEQVEHLFIRDYFPDSDVHVPAENLPAEEMEGVLREAGYSRIERRTYVYLDSADGSLPALHIDPLKLAGRAYLQNTSFFRRQPPEGQEEGLRRLAADLRSGALQARVDAGLRRAAETGHGTVFAAWP